MKKIYILTFFLILMILSGISFLIFKDNLLSLLNNNTGELKSPSINTILKKSHEFTKEELEKKVDTIKNRTKIKDIISKGDNYFQNDQLTLALIKYKEALKKNPGDELIIEKIGDTLVNMKKFNDANLYYEQIIKNSNFDVNKYVLSLLYSYDLKNKDNIILITDKINTKILDEEKKFFFLNSMYCLEDFHLCKKTFDEKLFALDVKIASTELIEIKNSVQNYTNFGLVDLYYKNALIIGSFMKLKLYPIAIILGEKMLEEKNDYKAIIQIIAQSYFELGDYQNANIHLKKYFELNPNDGNAAYLIGIINLKLGEYILSNIYFNKALNLNYDSLNVNRKLIYNYYILDNYEKMYLTFDNLIKNDKNLTLDDISPIINFAIENNKKEKAYEWTKLAINLFPNEITLYIYMGKLEIDRGFLELAINYINKGLVINPENQLLNFYLGLIKIKENKLDEAKIQLQKTYKIDKKSEVATEIKSEIEKIENGFYEKINSSGSLNN